MTLKSNTQKKKIMLGQKKITTKKNMTNRHKIVFIPNQRVSNMTE